MKKNKIRLFIAIIHKTNAKCIKDINVETEIARRKHRKYQT